jgi:hypothetical protein
MVTVIHENGNWAKPGGGLIRRTCRGIGRIVAAIRSVAGPGRLGGYPDAPQYYAMPGAGPGEARNHSSREPRLHESGAAAWRISAVVASELTGSIRDGPRLPTFLPLLPNHSLGHCLRGRFTREVEASSGDRALVLGVC